MIAMAEVEKNTKVAGWGTKNKTTKQNTGVGTELLGGEYSCSSNTQRENLYQRGVFNFLHKKFILGVPLWHSGLRTWYCHCSSSGCCCGEFHPWPRNSTCHWWGKKKKRKEKRKRKKRKEEKRKENYHEIPPHPVRMAIIIKSTINKRWSGCGERGTLLYCWRECKLVQPLWRTVCWYLRNLYIELPYDPAIPLLGIYPDKTFL